MSVIDAGVATIFVVFAEDPGAFRQSHPELHDQLVSAWERIGYNKQSGQLNYTRMARRAAGAAGR